MKSIVLLIPILAFVLPAAADAQDQFLHFPGDGKKVVIVTGDEEYRSEETGPMLGKILSKTHGFDVHVLFAINPETGFIDPNFQQNIPGTDKLDEADLMIIGTRFRQLPDEQLAPIARFLNAGKPVIGFRTATHAFRGDATAGDFKWAEFGLKILGETWVSHHGKHKAEGTRGVIEEANADHPVLSGVRSVFGTSDVYGIANLDQSAATILLRGAVTETLDPKSKALEGEKNDPMMPIAWLREYESPDGKTKGEAFCTTMGASVDFANPSLRRLVVNAAFHLTGQEVPKNANVQDIDQFNPTFYMAIKEPGFYEKRKLKVEDFALGKSAQTGLPVEKTEAKAAKGLTEPPQYPQPAAAPTKPAPVTLPLTPEKGETIALVGNMLGERMAYFGYLETQLQMAFPDHNLTVRNLCNPCDTPGLRPSPSQTDQWAFPGAEKFHPKYQTHHGIGHYPKPDSWLTEVKASTIIGFFGFNESFEGPEGLELFKGELRAWIDHSHSLTYDGKAAPKIVLVTPVAFEDRSADYDLPDGTAENAQIKPYAEAMVEIAKEKGVGAIDLFAATNEWLGGGEPYTINGCHLSESGYKTLAPSLVGALYQAGGGGNNSEAVRAAVLEKMWLWQNDYRILNGVHVYGQRWQPYGNVNYPEEIAKLRAMTKLRDQAIWDVVNGKEPVVDDSKTPKLSEIETNYKQPINYLAEAEALKKFRLPEGYKIELFASEAQFPLLKNPVQMSFDNAGRLWVAVLPSYPHYLPGGPKPDDKLIILEDTDNDGRADKQTVWADGLHLPIGFEIAPEGVYVSQEPNIILLKDTNGDDKADERHIIAGGFDSHDTHHAISAYCADASGAMILCEGRFLHSQVETPYGPRRMTDGGFWRFDPRSWRIERHAQTDVSNPWGVAFDEWGQDFLSDASGGANFYGLPLQVKIPHGMEVRQEGQFTTHRVRPTSGTEFVSSRHFPDEVQGDFLINNTIGFLGTKQHTVRDDGAGFTGELRWDLIRSDDPNYRPVDLEFAPDGSLYIVDWHNALIGHMQHSARDPNRDVDHGRVYRVTYPSRELVDPPKIAGAPVQQLLENLKLHEYRARYRTRRELRGRDAAEVLPAVKEWAAGLENDELYDRNLLEAMWVTWGAGQIDEDLLKQCLTSENYKVRAAGFRTLRYEADRIADSTDLFLAAAGDDYARVRLEAIVSASWFDNADGAKILLESMKKPVEKWMGHSVDAALWTLRDDIDALIEGGYDLGGNAVALAYLDGQHDFKPKSKTEDPEVTNVPAEAMALYKIGEEVYKRDAHCITCHQAKGEGLPNIYPPLIRNPWVEGEPERLIKIVLKGLWGDIEVNGEHFLMNKGVPPMMGFGPLLSDEEIAGVLTYVRYSFKNSASPVDPEMVAKIRKEIEDRQDFYTVEEILKEHPFPKKGAE